MSRSHIIFQSDYPSSHFLVVCRRVEARAIGRTTLNPSAFGATPYSAGKK